MTAVQPRPPVVVGVDGSESALDAVRWAALEAHHRRLPLRLVHAFGWPPEPPNLHAQREAFRERLLQATRDRLVAAAELAEQVAPGVEVDQHVEIGHPIPVLEAETQQANLLVLGDRGLGGVSGLLVGSVAVALAGHGACPLVVVRGVRDSWSPATSRPVVVGVDGSPASAAAIPFAFEAASLRGVPLIAVHTWWDLMVDATMAPLLDWQTIETDEMHVLVECLAGWAERYPDVTVQRIVTRDRPAGALLEQARAAQLVVVGARGRGAVAGLVLGSISHALLHRSPCPVAILRHDGA